MVAVSDGFVDAILESPLGVALIASLEARVRQPEGFGSVLDTHRDAVLRAAEAVEKSCRP